MQITSPQNPRVKTAISLRDKKTRHELNMFGVEGAREIERALSSDFEILEVFACPEILSPASSAILSEITRDNKVQYYEITPPIFTKIALRENSDGLFAIFRKKEFTLQDIDTQKNPLILVVENLEKPGNLGALLRSADGAGADAIVVLDHTIDPENPNVIRASLGTLFHIPVIKSEPSSILKFCQKNQIQIITTSLSASKSYYDIDFRSGTAVVLGSEAHGISDFWIQNSDHQVKIPMLGIADSLNVSVAGAVILYEALRQRSSNKSPN